MVNAVIGVLSTETERERGDAEMVQEDGVIAARAERADAKVRAGAEFSARAEICANAKR